MTCVWAAPPRCMSRGLRAYQRVYVQVSELTCDLSGEHSGYWLTCEHMHRARHLCAQNADHLAHNTPFSAFFTEVVCVLSAAPPQAATSQPQNGGNDAIQASDTPATRRQRASHGAKPHVATAVEGAASPTRPAQGRLARINSPSTAPPVTLPRKSSPSTRKNAEFGPI